MGASKDGGGGRPPPGFSKIKRGKSRKYTKHQYQEFKALKMYSILKALGNLVTISIKFNFVANVMVVLVRKILRWCLRSCPFKETMLIMCISCINVYESALGLQRTYSSVRILAAFTTDASY
jgi:hypothetical protein